MSRGARIDGIVPDHVVEKMSSRDRKEMGLATSREREMVMAEKLEKVLQRDAENLLRHRGVRQFLHMSHRAREKRGWPDLVFAYRGVPMAWELKGAGGRLSDDQKRVLAEMAADGWCTSVIRSVDEARGELSVVEEDAMSKGETA